MNRRTLILGVLAMPWLAAPRQSDADESGPDLSGYPIGPLPPEFLTGWRTGQGKPGDWQVVEDATASHGKAIAQLSADPTEYRFPLAVWRSLVARDLAASLRFKTVTGAVDRAGGLAVRLLDADNYYVARANALEDNVNLYRVVHGRRQQIAGASVKVSSGAWHALGLRAERDRLTVTFDGKNVATATDSTFAGAGRIALWTKADSVYPLRPARNADSSVTNSNWTWLGSGGNHDRKDDEGRDTAGHAADRSAGRRGRLGRSWRRSRQDRHRDA
jgi:hypothetical protein